MTQEKWITLGPAARLLDVSEAMARRMVARGELKPVAQVAHLRVFDADEVAALAARRRAARGEAA